MVTGCDTASGELERFVHLHSACAWVLFWQVFSIARNYCLVCVYVHVCGVCACAFRCTVCMHPHVCVYMFGLYVCMYMCGVCTQLS